MLRAPLSASGALAAAAPAAEAADSWSLRLAEKGQNSFDSIRLTLAILVIFEHSYFLTANSYEAEPLYLLTRQQFNSGSLAVCMFFAISGFLVTRSYLLTRNLGRYLAKRAARIMPGFLVATLVACIVMAPLVSTDPSGFFRQQNWFSIAVQALALRQVSVTGVLAGNAVPLIHGTLCPGSAKLPSAVQRGATVR